MGRIDFSYLAADGRLTAFDAPWLLVALISVLAVVAYVAASARTRAGSDRGAQRD